MPRVSVSTACYLADDLQNLTKNLFFFLSPRVSPTSASPRREKPRAIDRRVAMPSAASLYSSWINYTLMRGNALPIVKVRAGWRVSALRSFAGNTSRGILVKFHSASVAKSAVSRTVSRVSIHRFKLQLDGSRAGYPSESAAAIVYAARFYEPPVIKCRRPKVSRSDQKREGMGLLNYENSNFF